MSAASTLKLLAAWAASSVATLCAIAALASAQRAADPLEPSRAFVAATGSYAPCLSTSARWLRHPDDSERAAAQHDDPLFGDLDPAGAWIAPRTTDAR